MKRVLLDLWYNRDYRVELRVTVALFLGFAITAGMQMYSQRSISHLLDSDVNVMRNYELDNYFEDLDRDLITLESNVRSYIISGNRSFISLISANIVSARDRMALILKNGRRRSALQSQLQQLNTFVEAKIQFSESVLDSFHLRGEERAEELLSTQYGLRLRDSIIQITRQWQQLERGEIVNSITTNRQEAKRARLIDYISTIMAMMIVMLSILYLLSAARRRRIMQQNLLDARAAAEESAQVKGQFMANMSHEIRTPLNAIIGYTQLLNRLPLDDRQREYAAGIRQSSQNLLDIVDDILDFSRLEAGLIRLERIPFNLEDLLFSVEAMFSHRAEEKGISLHLDYHSEGFGLLMGDPTRLTQILTNLIGNAIKFTEQGSVELSCKLQPIKPGWVDLLLTVKDTGIGIAPEKLDTIFERFRQGNTDTTRRFGGSGLGLSIVKSLVEAHHGKISVSSRINAGSCFQVTIPYELSTGKKPNPERPAVEAPPAKPSLPPARILIVEDNPLNQRVLELLLADWGIRFDVADNGRIALQKLREDRFDLILMDIQMAEMDGYAAAEYIRQYLGLSIPIIAMTAHVLAGERERCLRHGMNSYLPKPIQEDALYEQLSAYLPAAPPSDTVATVLPATDLIDFEYLRSISRGKQEQMQEMAQLFLTQAPRELEAIRLAFTDQNREQFIRVVHSMKSTVGYMGMQHTLGQCLQDLEARARSQETFADLTECLDETERLTLEAITLINQKILT